MTLNGSIENLQALILKRKLINLLNGSSFIETDEYTALVIEKLKTTKK